MFAKLGQKIKNLFSGKEDLNKVADGSGVQLDEPTVSLNIREEELTECETQPERKVNKDLTEKEVEEQKDEDTIVPEETVEDTICENKHCEDVLGDGAFLKEDEIDTLLEVAETVVPAEPLIDETVVPAEPLIDETVVPAEPLIDETVVPAEPLTDKEFAILLEDDETVVPAEPLIDEVIQEVLETDPAKILAGHCEFHLQTLMTIFKTDSTTLKSFDAAKKKGIDTPVELFRRANKLRPKNKLLKDNLDALKIKLNVSEIVWPNAEVLKDKKAILRIDDTEENVEVSKEKEDNFYTKKNVKKLKEIFKNDSRLQKSFDAAKKKGLDTPEELFRRALQMRPSNKALKELLRSN
jgi:hypothetical protein